MGASNLQFEIFLLAAVVVGALIGWLIRGGHTKRRLNKQDDMWQLRLDDLIRQRDRFSAENHSFRSTIEAQQAVVREHEIAANKNQTEFESAREKTKLLSKDLFTLRAERDELNIKIANSEYTLKSVRQQAADLQTEFVKSGDFYKGELTKAFDKRKVLETKVENATLEHESVSNLLEASRSEHDSVNKMLAAAQTRLGNLDAIEQNVIKLEAENAQLSHDSARTRQEIEALRRDVAEMDELKIQNKELAHCLQSMENSRKQYEIDAKRYREHAGNSELQSETLRVKLDEIEKNFADMEQKQNEALKHVREEVAAQKLNGETPCEQENDDLKQIIGIGKVFEHALHKLGIFSYRQIAAFDVSDIARVNMELKEFKGRMEQDDWVGQAKELLFRKYGESS